MEVHKIENIKKRKIYKHKRYLLGKISQVDETLDRMTTKTYKTQVTNIKKGRYYISIDLIRKIKDHYKDSHAKKINNSDEIDKL